MKKNMYVIVLAVLLSAGCSVHAMGPGIGGAFMGIGFSRQGLRDARQWIEEKAIPAAWQFLKPYEEIGEIIDTGLIKPEVEDATTSGTADNPHVDNNLHTEDLITLVNNDRDNPIQKKIKDISYIYAERLGSRSSTAGAGIYRLYNGTPGEELFVIQNSREEIIECKGEFPYDPNLHNNMMNLTNIFMDQSGRRLVVQATELVKLKGKLSQDSLLYSLRARYLDERIWHPVRSTIIKYAVIAGTTWGSYKLLKRLLWGSSSAKKKALKKK